MTTITLFRHFENEIPLTINHGRKMSTISGNDYRKFLVKKKKKKKGGVTEGFVATSSHGFIVRRLG